MVNSALANTRVVFDENSLGETDKIAEETHYFPFGLTLFRQNVNANENKYQYNSKELIDEAGLDWYHYGARYYDPQLGRWHVTDPADEQFSPYVYCADNPIILLDPDGGRIDHYIKGHLVRTEYAEFSKPSTWWHAGDNYFTNDGHFMGGVPAKIGYYPSVVFEVPIYDGNTIIGYNVYPGRGNAIEPVMFGPIESALGAWAISSVANNIMNQIANNIASRQFTERWMQAITEKGLSRWNAFQHVSKLSSSQASPLYHQALPQLASYNSRMIVSNTINGILNNPTYYQFGQGLLPSPSMPPVTGAGQIGAGVSTVIGLTYDKYKSSKGEQLGF